MERYFLKITSVVRVEEGYFLKTLSQNVRRIMLSDSFYAISSPLVSVFLSAFIWRATHSFVDVAAYNVGRYLFHPITFFFNGFLLRTFRLRNVFMVGSVIAGLSVLIVVMFRSVSPWALFLYGCVYGVGYGLYWANRNYLEFQETVPADREYFFSMVSVVGNIASVLVPLLAGWFIVFGRFSRLYTGNHAYLALFAMGFLLMVFAGKAIYKGLFESPLPKHVSLAGVRRRPSGRRVLALVSGLMDGISFIPALLVLSLIGNEAVLGTITAIVALLTIVLTYLYGRLSTQDNDYRMIVATSLLFVACAVFLALDPGVVSATVYIIGVGISSNFFEIAFDPVSLDLSNQEMASDPSLRYAFIVDNETFLNMGRLLSIALAVGIAVLFAGHELVISPLVAGCLQAVLLAFFFLRFGKRMRTGSVSNNSVIS